MSTTLVFLAQVVMDVSPLENDAFNITGDERDILSIELSRFSMQLFCSKKIGGNLLGHPKQELEG